MSLKKHWYSKKYIQFEIVKQLKDRELAILSKDKVNGFQVRLLTAKTTDGLNQIINRTFNIMRAEQIYLYFSLAHIPFIPLFNANLKLRVKERDYINFTLGINKKMTGYDLAFDCDFKNHEYFEKQRSNLSSFKQILDDYMLPYVLTFSGSKGFHFRIPAEYMPKFTEKTFMICGNINENIANTFSFPFIDYGLSDNRRVFKLPYSYCDGNVVLPLDDKQFDSFDWEMVKVENVLNDIKLKNRGLLLRTHNLSTERLIKNTCHFIDDYYTERENADNI